MGPCLDDLLRARQFDGYGVAHLDNNMILLRLSSPQFIHLAMLQLDKHNFKETRDVENNKTQLHGWLRAKCDGAISDGDIRFVA